MNYNVIQKLNNLQGEKKNKNVQTKQTGTEKEATIILETVVTDGTKGLRLSLSAEQRVHKQKDNDTQIIQWAYWATSCACCKELPPRPCTNTHTHAHEHKQHALSDRMGVSEPKRDSSYCACTQTEKYITKCFISLLVMETGDTGKSNRGPVGLMWAVTGELSRRWNFAGFNLTDRRYKLLPEVGHFMVPLACRSQKKKENEQERQQTSKAGIYVLEKTGALKNYNNGFRMLWTINYKSPIPHITAKNTNCFWWIFWRLGSDWFSFISAPFTVTIKLQLSKTEA